MRAREQTGESMRIGVKTSVQGRGVILTRLGAIQEVEGSILHRLSEGGSDEFQVGSRRKEVRAWGAWGC